MKDTAARPVEPPVTDTSEPFWNATRDHRLIIQWCTSCEVPVWFPRDVCPRCLGSGLEWRAASGKATVHAFVVEYREPFLEVLGNAPYVVALVELAEGVRMMTNIVGCPPADVAVGLPVAVTWEPLSDGRNLPLFQPSG